LFIITTLTFTATNTTPNTDTNITTDNITTADTTYTTITTTIIIITTTTTTAAAAPCIEITMIHKSSFPYFRNETHEEIFFIFSILYISVFDDVAAIDKIM
jgi:hypothetical protein